MKVLIALVICPVQLEFHLLYVDSFSENSLLSASLSMNSLERDDLCLFGLLFVNFKRSSRR